MPLADFPDAPPAAAILLNLLLAAVRPYLAAADGFVHNARHAPLEVVRDLPFASPASICGAAVALLQAGGALDGPAAELVRVLEGGVDDHELVLLPLACVPVMLRREPDEAGSPPSTAALLLHARHCRRVLDAAQADGVTLSLADGLDDREIAWMQRSIATMQAYSIMDSIRANRTAALASSYNQGYVTATCNTPTATGVVAADDLADWNAAIACNLPSGQGKITVVSSGTITIFLRWKEGMAASDPYVTWSTETSL
jgi:hypothetical protein